MTHAFRSASTLAIIAALASSTPVWAQDSMAQEDQPSDEQPTDASGNQILVEGRRDSQLDIFGNLPIGEAPLSIRVFDSEAIAKTGATTFAQVLYADPSFSPQNGVRELGSGLTNGIIRGFAVSRFLNNGLPQSLGLAFIPAEAVERIEVLRGPAGFNFGFVAPGGAVNTVTKSPKGRDRTFVAVRREAAGTFAGHFENEGTFADDRGGQASLARPTPARAFPALPASRLRRTA